MSFEGKQALQFIFCFISEPVPQVSKATSSTVEADQSIDEILGLQVLKN